MSFLSRFSTNAAPAPSEADAAYARRRTFSATQFRDEELARAAEVRAAREAAEQAAQEAADAFRAARLAEAEAEAEEDGDFAETPGEPPMDWEEAVGWLSTRSPEARNFIAQQWNWEQDLRVLQFLMAQPDTDLGVAAGIFWLSGATDDFFPWGDEDSPAEPQYQRAADMVDQLGRRFEAGDFGSTRFGFDDSWDCTALKERLEELYLDGRIDWSPANLPTASPGPQPTLEDVPEEERGDVLDFLARHGA
jgi:hypothetical protein